MLNTLLMVPYVACNGLAALAFLLAREAKSPSKVLPIIATAPFAILISLKAVFFIHPALEATIFPLPTFASLNESQVFTLALLILGLLLSRASKPRTGFLIYLAAALTFAAGLRVTYKFLDLTPASPIAADTLHHCAQSTPQTCAPAACVSALSYINLNTTESTMARLCLTTSLGTTDYNIFCGITATLQNAHAPYRAAMAEISPDQLARPGTLAVISINSHSHAVCTLGTGNAIIVQDPLFADPQIWSRNQLAAAYSGVATIISPAGSD
jgi:hypothetical protein